MTPTTILFLSANPDNTPQLRVNEEARSVDQARRLGRYARSFAVQSATAVRYADLQVYLLDYQPQIVHFGGHGDPDLGLVVEGEAGEPFTLSAEVLADLFAAVKHNIRCVVLNACYTLAAAKAIARTIDCVIAFVEEVEDELAIVFAEAFYQALASGCDVATAHKLGANRMKAKAENSKVVHARPPRLIARRVDPAQVYFVTPGLTEPDDAAAGQLPRARVDAVLYKDAAVMTAPRLYGRAELLVQVQGALVAGERLLLTGLVGVGKTALAAVVARTHAATGRGRVLWLECGAESEDTLFDALARLGEREQLLPPGGGAGVATLTGPARHAAFLELLASARVTLVVLDDACNGAALQELLAAVPAEAAVLATSYLRLPAGTILEVPDLAPEMAARLLCHHAERHDESSPAVAELCRVLGCHPLALELAGNSLKVDGRSPAELLDRIRSTPHALALPGSFAHPQRDSISALLNTSVEELSPAGRQALAAFGALFAATASDGLLQAAMNSTTTGSATVRGAVGRNAAADVQEGLDALARRSLARRRPNTGVYEMHSLTYSYARALAAQAGVTRQAGVDAVLAHLRHHAHDIPLLDSDLANITAAAQAAQGADLVEMLCILAAGSYPQPQPPSYFDLRSGPPLLLDALQEAIAAAETSGSAAEPLHYLVSKWASAAYRMGDLATAAAAYKRAMDLAPTPARHSLLAGNLALALARLGDMEKADALFAQAAAEAREQQSLYALNTVLYWQCLVAGSIKRDYALARQLALECLEAAGQLGDPLQIGLANANLAAAELSLGIDRALRHHGEALRIFKEMDNQPMVAQTLQALAEDYHALCDFDAAQEHLRQALALCKTLGDKAGHARTLAFVQKWGYTADGPAARPGAGQ